MFDNMIRHEMIARGLTAPAVATALAARGMRISAEAVRLWASGRTMPGFRAAMALAQVFEWSHADIMRAAGYDDPS